ncbi:DNA repair protein rad50 [Holothuria leucospilota]|uniref:DNA repair protein rad50 n=1 Tax=Holothuria leucospilota TaxID=206669 RepID=A0A9Q1BJJ2_HOLLE|nr:DNA repair protein rad50 [Holothuria leucospilota]
MSHFKRITIKGIRSFSPEEKEKQILEFGTPLTVILGENGTGKTSIIECLRYACSGEYPPGGREAFLHSLEVADPKSAEGEIALDFTNKGNQDVAIRRCVTVKENKRQQEGWYKIGDHWQPVTSKKDLSMMMNDELGVSSSILSNVLFCHQAESCWPLDKERALKEKFDRFFEVTKYNKLLAELTYMINKQKCELNWYEDKAKDIEQSQENVDRLAKVIENEELEKVQVEAQIADLEEKCLAAEKELSDVRDKIRIGEEIKREINYLEGRRRDLDTDRVKLKERLVREYSQMMSSKDLQQEVAATESGIKKLERFKKISQGKAESLRKEMENLQNLQRLQEEKEKKQARAEELYNQHYSQLKEWCGYAVPPHEAYSKANEVFEEKEKELAMVHKDIMDMKEVPRKVPNNGLCHLEQQLNEKKTELNDIESNIVIDCSTLPEDLDHIMSILIGALACVGNGSLQCQMLKMQEDVWKSVETLSTVKEKATKIGMFIQEKITKLQLKVKSINEELNGNKGLNLAQKLSMKKKCAELQLQEQSLDFDKDVVTKLICHMYVLDQTLKEVAELDEAILKQQKSCGEANVKRSLEEAAKEHQILLEKISDIDDNLKQSFEKLSGFRKEEEKKRQQYRDRADLNSKRTLTMETDSKLQEEKKKKEYTLLKHYKMEEERLKELKRNINSKKFTYKGTLTELTKTIEERRAEYYRMENNVNKESRDNSINIMTMRDVNHDLEQYRNALDEAIVKFHKMKLREVNEETERLWKKTYQGNDIDSIKIEAAVDKRDGRRAYNYRVEMVKGRKRMNMRERCSMGQKVLASLIIRIALARIFGGSCGVLALDEPTTNLDEANVKALAKALKSIIAECENQSNFQLIIISHNETFVDILARDYGKHCYKVTRGRNKHSVVVKYDTAFLHLPMALVPKRRDWEDRYYHHNENQQDKNRMVF